MSIARIEAIKLRDWVTFNRLACIAALLLAAAAYVPLLAQYAAELWSTPGYRLAPVVLVLAVLSARRRAGMLKNIEPAAKPAAVTGGLAAALLGLAVVAQSPEMAAASLAVLGMAAALRWGGRPAARAVLGPWLLACFVLRLPAGLDLLCFEAAVRFSVANAHRVLDAFGVMHDVDGLRFLLPTTELWFGAARYCLFSPWSGAAIVLAVCIWMRRSWIDSLLLLVAGCGWFVMVDVLRIIATVLLSGVLETPVRDGVITGLLDYAALLLMFSLVLSTDHVGLLFGKAVRLARPAKRARSAKTSKTPLPMSTVTVTGVTLDANGQLVKVVNEYVPERLLLSPRPPEAIAAPARPAWRLDWPLVAAIYGLLCMVQVIWLASASDAATAQKTPAEIAMQMAMPAESAGWRLDQSTADASQATGPGKRDARSAPVASWTYRWGDLKFQFSVRSGNRAAQNAVDAWLDRGWQLAPPSKSADQKSRTACVVDCREVRFSKFYQPGYACIWESTWDAGQRSWTEPQTGWLAPAVVAGQRAEQIYRGVQKLGHADRGGFAASGGLAIEGSLVAYRQPRPEEYAVSRELYCHLAAKLERELTPNARVRP